MSLRLRMCLLKRFDQGVSLMYRCLILNVRFERLQGITISTSLKKLAADWAAEILFPTRAVILLFAVSSSRAV